MKELENEGMQKFPQLRIESVQQPTEYISGYKMPYVSPTPGEMPLIGCGMGLILTKGGKVDENGYFSVDYLNLMKECGLNCVQAEVSHNPNGKEHPDYPDPLVKHPIMESINNCNTTGVREVVRIWRYLFPEIPAIPATIQPGMPAYEEMLRKIEELYKEEEKQSNYYLSDWKKAIELVFPYKAAGAYHLYDEPTVRYFKWAARVKDAIIARDKWNTLIYDNLLPLWAEEDPNVTLTGRKDELITTGPLAGSGQKITYSYYLDEYERIFAPSVWCYDCYLLGGSVNGGAGNPLQKIPSYLKNLEVIRDQAYKNNRPFWVNVRTLYVPFTFLSASDYGRVLDSEFGFSGSVKDCVASALKCEVFSSLAFGAQGINFWAMVSRPTGEGGLMWAPLYYPFTSQARAKIAANVPANTTAKQETIVAECKKAENYDNTEIKKSSLYDEVKLVTAEVRKLQRYFLGATCTDAWNYNIKVGNNTLLANDASYQIPLFGDSQKWMKVLECDGGLLISHLTNPAQQMEIMVVVNFSYDETCHVSLEFTKTGVIERTGRDNPTIGPGPIFPGLGKSAREEAEDSSASKIVIGPSFITKYQSDIKPGDWRVFTLPMSNA